jgi:uncharacterized protein with PIN domain
MLTPEAEIKANIAKLETAIVEKYSQIEESEASTALYRRQCEDLHRQRATLEKQLQREVAPQIKPHGKCVTEIAHDGIHWHI